MCGTSFKKYVWFTKKIGKNGMKLESWSGMLFVNEKKYILYLLIIDVQIGSKISKKYLQFVEVFSYLFYWGSNLNTIGFCQRCGDTLPLKRKWKIYVGFDLTVSFVKMQMRPRFLLFLTLLFLTLFSSVFFCWSIKWLEKKIF